MNPIRAKRCGTVRPATFAALATCAVFLLSPAVAYGAPPPNDNRADAIALPTFPGSAHGTTGEATVERLDPQVSDCGLVEGSVWYRIDSAPDGHIVVTVRADSTLAPVVRVYRRGSSSINEVDCGSAGPGGSVVTSFQTARGAGYLILVGHRPSAADGEFDLTAELHLPPANDRRPDAEPLGRLPRTISGTTLGATADESEGACGLAGGTVWYSLQAPAGRRVVLRLAAAGELDAVVAVFERVRSRLERVTCAPTDRDGHAVVVFDGRRGARFLIVVGQRAGSDPGQFSLSAGLAEAPEALPGRSLPARGVRASVHAVTDVNDVWSVRLRPGATYLVAFGSDTCATATLRPPARARRGLALRRLRCSGYTSITPGPAQGGRYAVEVEASGVPRKQAYRLRVALASGDDIGVGAEIGNRATVHGGLAPAGIDVVDLYHFDVARPADVRLTLAQPAGRSFTVLLLRDTGARIGASDGRLDRRLSPGRYVVAVRGAVGSRAGPYRVSLLLRAVTATLVSISGTRQAQASPGAAVHLTALVTPPSTGGRVELTVERFDPLTGWHFHRLFQLRAGAAISWTPPALGRWRIRARFRGTMLASPSASSYAYLVVGKPIR